MTKNRVVYKAENISQTKVPLACSYRLFLAFLAFLGVFLCYAQRREEFLSNEFFHALDAVNTTVKVSFGLGYVLAHVPSSLAVNLCGPQRFFALIICISSIFTALSPFFTNLRITLLLRFFIGAAQGGLWPTIFRLWSTWAPASERTTLLSFQIAGPAMSVIVSLTIFNRLNTILMADDVSFISRYGWTYYIFFGTLGLIWAIIWLVYSSDTPMTNRHVSLVEKEYIRTCKVNENIQDIDARTPWRAIFASRSFWCIMITMFLREIGVHALWRLVPAYMDEILHFQIRGNSLLSVLIHVAIFVSILLTGALADFIMRTKCLNRRNTRKLFHAIGALGTAVCLMVVLFLDGKHLQLAISLYIVGIVINDFMKTGGYFVNIEDFSGIHSSVVLAMGEAFSSMSVIIVLNFTNAFTKYDTINELKIVSAFYTTGFFMAVIIFTMSARAEPEFWACNQQIDEDRELIPMEIE